MGFTRAEIQAMNEDDLRRRVLMPLFRKMGFRDVMLYHGSILEQGKDIVMWKPDDFTARQNYAVIAKVGRITGSVTGRSGAGGVFVQLQQAIGSDYADPITTRRETVNRCIVVSSGEITKEARETLSRTLASANLNAVTDFVDGDLLWKLVEQHMPEVTLDEQIDQVRKVISGRDKDYEVAAVVREGGAELKLLPRHAGAEPLRFAGTFAFPETEEGTEAKAAFERFLRTGEPVRLRKPFIREIKLPPVIEHLLGAEGGGVSEIELGPRRGIAPLRADLVLQDEHGGQESLRSLELKLVRVGSEEITLSNEQQSGPWHVRMTLNPQAKSFTVRFDVNFTGVSAAAEYHGLRFIQLLTGGGVLRLVDADSGLDIGTGRIPASVLEPPEESYVRFVQALATIQAATRRRIAVNVDAVSMEDARTAFVIEQIVQTGRLTYSGPATLKFVFDRDHLKGVVAAFESTESLPIEVNNPGELRTVMGVDIDLGPVTVRATQVTIEASHLAELKEKIAAGAPSAEVRLNAASEAVIGVMYSRWLPPEQQSEAETSTSTRPPNV
jgi:hypothetical protein